MSHHRTVALVAFALMFPTAVTAQLKLKIPQRSAPYAVLPAPVTEQVTLTEPKLKSFFEAYKELQEKGHFAKGIKRNPADPVPFAQALKLTGDPQKILLAHEFKDVTEFQKIGYNASLAHAVMEQGGKDAIKERLDEARRKQQEYLVLMKQKLTPEQSKQMEAQFNASLGIDAILENVPDTNVALVAKHADQMKKLTSP